MYIFFFFSRCLIHLNQLPTFKGNIIFYFSWLSLHNIIGTIALYYANLYNYIFGINMLKKGFFK